MIIEYNHPDDSGPGSSGGSDDNHENRENHGTLILDATCAPQQISYSQDVNLLNEARENLESIIDTICYEYNLCKPIMYRENARKDNLSLAKCRKCAAKRIRQAIKKQLQYVRHDIGHINRLLETEGVSLSVKALTRLNVIRELFFHSRNTCIKTTSIALRTGSSVLASHYRSGCW